MQVSGQSMATFDAFCRPMKVVYPAPAVRSCADVCVRYLREHWTKIAVSIIGGVLAGFFAGAVSSREYLPLDQVVHAAGTTLNANAPTLATAPPQNAPAERNQTIQATQQEVSRLQAENQQLQALVDELQKERPAVHTRRVKTHHRRRAGMHA